MSQRNPMNERYNDENRGGKTRKSAASAKPSAARAATVREPRAKTKKEKKAELEEKRKRNAEKGGVYTGDGAFEATPEYKKLRRIWAVCLGIAVFMVLISVLSVQNEVFSWAYIPAMVIGYVLIIAAFYIDFRTIRKARREFYAARSSNSKEARAAQKKARAEAREQQKEAEEKFAAAQAEKEAKRANGFLARFRKPSADDPGPDSKEDS